MFDAPCNVSELLPHADPMILLDRVLDYGEGTATVLVVIAQDSQFFVEGNGVPTYVGLEYMAQACGVYAGLEARAVGASPRMGFLLGTRNFQASVPWFALGDQLVVKVSEVLRQEMMGVFDCQIILGENVVASAQLNLYQPD